MRGIWVEYLRELPEGMAEKTIPGPRAKGVPRKLVFRPDPKHDGRMVVPFPSEDLALDWMDRYNRGKTDPPFAIAHDILDDDMMKAVGKRVVLLTNKQIGTFRTRIEKLEARTKDLERKLEEAKAPA